KLHTTLIFFTLLRPPPSSTLFPYTTLFRSEGGVGPLRELDAADDGVLQPRLERRRAVGKGRPAVCHCLLKPRRAVGDPEEETVVAAQELPGWVEPRRRTAPGHMHG